MSSTYVLEAEAVGCDEVWTTAFVNDKVFTGGLDGQLRVYDGASSKDQPCASSSASTSKAGQSLGIVSVAASDSFILTNQLHSELCRWELDADGTSLRKQASKALGSNAAWSLGLHPSEEIVATAAESASLKLIKASVQGFGEVLHAAQPSTSNAAKSEFALCCRFSPNGDIIAVSTTSGQIFLSDAKTGHLLQSFPAHSKSIRTLTFSSDSNLLITGSDDKRIGIFDIRGASRRQSGGSVASLEGHAGWILSTDVRSDGKTLASGSTDGVIKLWDLASTSSPFTTLQSEKDVWSLSWKPHPPPAAGFEGVGGPGIGGGALVAGTSAGLQWWRATG